MAELDKSKPAQPPDKAKSEWHPLVKTGLALLILAFAYVAGKQHVLSLHDEDGGWQSIAEALVLIPVSIGLSVIVAGVGALIGGRARMVTLVALATAVLLMAVEAGMWQILG